MGSHIAFTCAPALHDSNGRPFSMEFSLAAIFSSGPGSLRGGSASNRIAIKPGSHLGASAYRVNRHCRIDLPCGRLLRSAAQLDSYWTGCGLVGLRVPVAPFQISLVGTRGDHILPPTRHVFLHPVKL